MKQTERLMFALSAAVSALLLSAPAAVLADDEENEFEVADVYAELNDTDGDLGIHALIDGDEWKFLRMRDPNGRRLLDVRVKGRLRRQGLTELFFESAEPTFDELPAAEFFARFPEGEYEIRGLTLDHEILESEDLFWHVMPAQPGLQDDDETIVIMVGGEEDEIRKEYCDDEEPEEYDPIEVPADPVTIDWDPVDRSHPTIGRPGDIEVDHYEVVVEALLDDYSPVLSVQVPGDVTEMTIPDEFLALSDEFKYEVLVKEATGGNQTAVESCFVLAE